MSPAASAEYSARVEARRKTYSTLSRKELRISQLRLGAFGVAIILAAFIWPGSISGFWLVLPIVAFAALAMLHDRTLRARDAAARAVTFYERGLARIGDRWIGTGETGERFTDEKHLYANDLDLFGRGSLFELLSIARTRAGEETLADWLKTPAPPDDIAARHAAVAELTSALDLREALSLAGAEVRAGVDPEELIAWAEGVPRLFPSWKQWAAVVLSSVTLVTVAVWLRSGNYLPMLLALAVQGTFQGRQRRVVDAVLHAADAPARELSILFHVLQRLERERFHAPRLVELHDRIGAESETASAIIRRLRRLVEAHDWEHNMIFAPWRSC